MEAALQNPGQLDNQGLQSFSNRLCVILIGGKASQCTLLVRLYIGLKQLPQTGQLAQGAGDDEPDLRAV